MKKKLLPLLVLLLVPFGISACSSSKASLTYGTYIKSEPDSLKELSTTELKNKATEDKEVFLLAVYQDKYSDDCLCWNTFKNVIANYSNTYHEVVYTFNAYNQDIELKKLNIEKREDSTPLLYIFNGEKLITKFSYGNSQDKAIFEDLKGEAMNTRIHRKVNKPTMYHVNEEWLDENYTKTEELCLLFFRNKCGDCKYVMPNVIIPYIYSHNIKKQLYVFDIQPLYDLITKDGRTDKDALARYQALKEKYGLSEAGNPTYGYQNGVVPTIQYVKNGKLEDASVYFNDSLGRKDTTSFYVLESFYSEERLPNLKYLKGMSKEQAVIEGKPAKAVINAADGTIYWNQSEADQYHRPLLEAFLKYYML